MPFVGSKVTVEIDLIDLLSNGDQEPLPINSIAVLTVEVHKPSTPSGPGAILASPPPIQVVNNAGQIKLDFPAGVLLEPGEWWAQPIADGSRGSIVRWRMEPIG